MFISQQAGKNFPPARQISLQCGMVSPNVFLYFFPPNHKIARQGDSRFAVSFHACGGTQRILGRYVPWLLPRFSKVGTPELIFFGLKLGSPEKKFSLKFVSQELKFSQNRQKLGLKIFWEVGSLELEKGMRNGGSPELKMAWNFKGVLSRALARARHPRHFDR